MEPWNELLGFTKIQETQAEAHKWAYDWACERAQLHWFVSVVSWIDGTFWTNWAVVKSK